MVKRKYALTETEIIEKWAVKFPSVQVWLSKINGTKANRALRLFYFCDWCGKDPEKLLGLKDKPGSLEVERLLDLFVSNSTLPESTRWNSVNAVKSFFRCNYMQLQKEAGKIDYVTKKAAKRPSKTERRELYRGCFNERDRALILVACTSSMALETLSNLRWRHFEENWQSQQIPHVSVPSELIKGHGRGRYKGVRQETFITPEAKRELIKYREYMGKKGVNWTEDMNVFLSVEEPYHALTYAGIARTIRNISENSGVAFSVHDGRRIVETALENINVPRNWVQKVKGRKVRGEDAPYSKPAVEQLRQKYKEALSELEFLAEVEETEQLRKKDLEVRDLEKRLAALEEDHRRFLGISAWENMTEGQKKAALELLEVARKLSKERG